MDDVWDKLDRYTKSDYLKSSDDESHEVYFERTEHLYISTKKFSQSEAVDNERLCSEDVDTQQESAEEQREIQENQENQEIKGNIYESLLDEMKKSELHCNSETRNVQEKIDEMSTEKSQQKDELNEMQHKAQVISKSARMSAADVLSTITSSETMDHEESGQMDEYYDRIRSTDTDENPPEDSHENERKSSSITSSDVDLPNISPLSTPLNTGLMKSKANVARQGSMKARRKPTTVKRKSWTPGMDEYNIPEQDEVMVEDVQENEQGDTWVTTQHKNEGDGDRTGSITPSDSSSEDEKEVVKPHLRSAIAMPGLGDALKIQMTRSELKRPTALSLAKTAKDVKENEVSKEDKLETSPSKPDWMKEVEERNRQPRAAPQRRHKTFPARCSELDTLFEQRKQVQSSEPFDSTTLEGTSGTSRPKSFPGEDIDPELQKMFERRKNLTPLEVEGEGGVVKEPERPKSFHGDQIDPELNKMFEKRKDLTPLEVEGDGGVVKEAERPKSFHGDKIDPELSKMFEKRKNLKPLEVDGSTSGEGTVAKEIERPKSFHGDQMDSELNKMFQRRNNLKPVEGRAGNRDNEEDQVFEPRNVHLQNSQATELDKIFEKRMQLGPVEGVRSHTPQGRFDESSTVVVSSSPDLRQTSGIVRARFHDTKLEPLPNRGEVMKVATVSAAEVRTARQVQERRRISPETVSSTGQVGRGTTHANVGQLPVDGHGGLSKPPRTPTSGAQVAEFVFNGRGASQATVGRIPDQSGPSKPPRTPTSGAQVAEFVFDGRGASQATVGRIPDQSGPSKPPRTPTGGAQVAEFVFDGREASHATVGRIPDQSGPSKPPRTPTGGAQVAEFVFDGRGASHTTVGRIPVGEGGLSKPPRSKPPHPKPPRPPTTLGQGNTSGAQVAEFVFDGRRATRATVDRIPVGESGPSKPPRSKPPHPPTTLEQGNTSGAQVAEFVFDGRGASQATVGPVSGNQRGSLNTIGQHQRTLPEERDSGQEASGAQVAQFAFDGSAATSRATVGWIPDGGSQDQALPSRVDSRGDHVNNRGDHVARDDYVMSTRAHVIESRDVNTKQTVISPTSSKSDARSFIEQLSRKQVPEKGQGVSQGKSVSKPRLRDNPSERNPSQQGRLESYMDKEYPIPSRSHHSDPRSPPREGNIPLPHSQPHVSPSEELPPRNLPLRNLPPINRHSTDAPSQNSNLRSLPHSLSYPPNSQFPNHPPLNTKTSDPQLSYPPHSPRAPKDGRVTSPRPVRVREVKSPVREVDSEVNRVGYERLLPNELSRNVEEESSVRLRNGEMPNSGSVIPNSNGRHDKELDQRIRRGRSPKRSDHQKIQRVQSSDRSGDQTINTVRSPERHDKPRIKGHQYPDLPSNEKINRVRSPERSNDQRTNRIENTGNSADARNNRVKSPDRSSDQELKGHQNYNRLNDERISLVQNPDRSGDPRLNRIRSPDRSGGQRMNRVRSPDRSNDQKFSNAVKQLDNSGDQRRNQNSNRSDNPKVKRKENPESDQRINRVKSPDRSGDQRNRDVHVLRERVRSSNEFPSNYQSPVENESLNIRITGNGHIHKIKSDELNFKQNRNAIDPITNGIQNDKNFENRSRAMRVPSSAGRGNILNRENVERPKPVTVTVKSLSETPVYSKSPVIGRVRSHDRTNMMYDNGECMVNGRVNGDVGRRGVKTERPKPNLDVQSSESPAIPKWKQELQAKKRLQKERQGETSTRQKDNIKPEQSGNDMAEWQKRLQGIRKIWGAEESEDPTGNKDDELTSQGDHVTRSDVDEQNNVPGFLKEFQQKKNKQNVKDDTQDTETFV